MNRLALARRSIGVALAGALLLAVACSGSDTDKPADPAASVSPTNPAAAVQPTQPAQPTSVSVAAQPTQPPAVTSTSAAAQPTQPAQPPAAAIPTATTVPVTGGSNAGVSANLGSSCSVRNGVSQVTFSIGAQATGGLRRITLTVDGAGVFDSGDLSAQSSYQGTQAYTPTQGTHEVKLVATTAAGGSAEKNGTLTVTSTGCSVQIR